MGIFSALPTDSASGAALAVILADVAIVAALLWALIVWLRGTRARFAVAGLAIVFGLYAVAQQLGLQLTVRLFQYFFAAAALILIVVFQDDLRRLFERIAVAGLLRRRPRPGPGTLETLVGVLVSLARTRTGALIVVPGRDVLDRYLDGGTYLRGRVSAALLESLFDVHSAGHDGAVVLEGNEVSRFGVHLPLSSDLAGIARGGTRHAAAMGLTERSDALCIVVSEERGTVSVAQGGLLREVDAEGLRAAFSEHIRLSNPPRRQQEHPLPGLRNVPNHWREGLFASVIAVAMFAVLVPEEDHVSMGFAVPVQVANLPDGYEIESVNPAEVHVTVSGPRRSVTLANPANVKIRLDGAPVELGRRTFTIEEGSVEHPDALQVVTVAPPRVKIRVARVADAG